MLQESIVFDPLAPRFDASRSVQGSATDIVLGLVDSLQELGLTPGLMRSGSGMTAGGTDLQVWPRELGRCDTATEHFLRRIAEPVHDGVPVTLSLKELGPDESAIEVLERFCATIRSCCQK
jgi:hypothetical protein